MSSLASYAAPFETEDDNLQIKKQNAIQQKRLRNNKTMKRRDNQNSNTINNPKLEAMMTAIKKSIQPRTSATSSDNWLQEGDDEGDNDDDDESSNDKNMGTFTPISPPHSASSDRLQNGMEVSSNHPVQSITHNQEMINKNVESFSQLPGTYAKQYQQQYIPYYNQSSDDLSPNGANRDELLEKLHQIIFMLEEHKNNKNANSTEEIILYFFLGIFIIFIIDSFARVGKYVR